MFTGPRSRITTTGRSRFLRVRLLPTPRCYLLGRRVHHGLVGLLLVLHDVRDFRVWVRDFFRGDI